MGKEVGGIKDSGIKRGGKISGGEDFFGRMLILVGKHNGSI